MEEYETIRQLISSFREVNQQFYRRTWQHADDLGITIFQLQILRVLSIEQNLSLQDLTKELHVGKSTVSSTIDRLVKAGLVKREQSSQDRRAIVLNLTDLGHERQKSGQAMFYEKLKGLDRIPKEQIDELLDIHQLIIKNLKSIGDDNS